MDGVVHVLDGLLDLELLGVELVFELVNGGFKLADLKSPVKLEKLEKPYHLLGVLSTVLGILEFLLE